MFHPLYSQLFDIQPFFLDGAKCQCDADWDRSDCILSYDKIWYILDGEGECIVGEKIHPLSPGTMMLIPAHTPHSFRTEKNRLILHYYLHFVFSPNGIPFFNSLEFPYHTPLGINDEILHICNLLVTLLKKEEIGAMLMQKALLLELISTYLMLNQVTMKPPISPDFQNVIHYINENISKKIELQTLADIAHMNSTAFIRAFKKEFHQPPMNFIQNKKMAYAEYLVRHTTLSFGTIADMIGFEEQNYFSNAFKKHTGLSPKALRNDSQRKNNLL